MKFRIPCEQANHICDKSQYKEATLLEKIKLNIHLIYCRACREYTRRNQKLTRSLKSSQWKTLSTAEKNLLKKQLHQELKK